MSERSVTSTDPTSQTATGRSRTLTYANREIRVTRRNQQTKAISGRSGYVRPIYMVIAAAIVVALVLVVTKFAGSSSAPSVSSLVPTSTPASATSLATPTPTTAPTPELTPTQVCSKYFGELLPQAEVPDGASVACRIGVIYSTNSEGVLIALFDSNGAFPDACLDYNWTLNKGGTYQAATEPTCDAPVESESTAETDCQSQSGDYFAPGIDLPEYPPPYHWYADLAVCSMVPLQS